jgi:hypothetical protein
MATNKEQSDMIKLKIKHDLKRHEQKMIELAYARESEKISHNDAMERQRIKSAEIRKMQERKNMMGYPRG